MLANLADEVGYGTVQTSLSRLRKPECLVGKGGFAVVLRHWHAPLGAPLAVKRACMGPWKFGLLATSVRECGVQSELGCLPRAASAHFTTCAAPPFVLKSRVHMPLVDADCDLASVLHRLRGNGSGALAGVPGCPSLAALAGALSPGGVVPWLSSCVLRALAALHQAGWLHRDLKPENLLLCPRDFSSGVGVRLCDFGTAVRAPDASSGCTALDVASVAAEHLRDAARGQGAGGSARKRPRSASGDAALLEPQPAPTRWEGGMHGHVSTLPFRAPELVMGVQSHAAEVDAWGAGVTLAEVLRCALQLELAAAATAAAAAVAAAAAPSAAAPPASVPLPGIGFSLQPLFAQNFDGELALLGGIGRILGPPCERVWPGAKELPGGYMSFAAPCRHCGSGLDDMPAAGAAAGASGAPPQPRPTPPAWCLPETLASSCAAGPSSSPLFHLHAAESLWSWLVGEGALNAYDAPVVMSQAARAAAAAAAAAAEPSVKPFQPPPRPLLAAQVDLLLRLLAWDPSRRLLPCDALSHPALTALAQPGAPTPWSMLLTLCRSLSLPPKVEAPLRGAAEEGVEEEEEEEEEGGLPRMPIFARGALSFE